MGKEVNREVAVPKVAVLVVEEFRDVCPDELLYGLPPLCDIHH